MTQLPKTTDQGIVIHCPMCGVTTIGATHSCHVEPATGGNIGNIEAMISPRVLANAVPADVVMRLMALQDEVDRLREAIREHHADFDHIGNDPPDGREMDYWAASERLWAELDEPEVED